MSKSNKNNKLKKITKEIKLQTFDMLTKKGGGHYGGSFSCAEILTNIFFKQKKEGDHFILSKAHAGVIYYTILAKKGKIRTSLLKTYGKENSRLGVHGEHDLVSAIEFSCGSLGHGLSYACGLALANKINKKNKKVFVLLGDGECQEGSVWEAAMFAGHHKLDNLIVYLDFNKQQSSGKIKNILKINPIIDKWKSFSWNVLNINGHSHNQINNAFKKIKKNKPNIIIADTIKGKGLSFLEKKSSCHYDRLDNKQINKAYEELKI